MIRFIHCMKRRPDITVGEFREYWNSKEFIDLIDRTGKLFGAVKIARNLTFNIEINTQLMEERGAQEPFDGIMEIWLESAKDLEAVQD